MRALQILFFPKLLAQWIKLHTPPMDHLLNLTFILHLNTSDSILETHLHTLTDPQSVSYGQYLNQTATHALFQPLPTALSFMRDFASQHNVHNVSICSQYKDHWHVQLSIRDASQLFQANFFYYHHSSIRIIRPEEFTVPLSFHPHILFIHGLHFPSKQQTLHSMQQKSSIQNPANIRAYYHIPKLPRRKHGIKLFLGSFLHERYALSDLRSFESRYLSTHHTISTSKDCLAYPMHATGEASLDVQVAVSMTQSEYISVYCDQSLRDPSLHPSDGNQEPFLQFFRQFNELHDDSRPSVVSVSYSDDECAVPRDYARAVNRELLKLAIKGVTVVVSSGDAGVQGSAYAESYCKIPACSRKNAMFPSSSPYVLSVGATTLMDGTERVTSASEGDLITSGGGMSALFSQPTYQTQLNLSMRAYPDVSAVGHGFPVIVNNQAMRMDGTSVSAPIVASIIVVWNAYLKERDAPMLGFLNPLLYRLYDACPHVFHDIVDGNNRCGTRSMPCCDEGYDASPGFDMTSGLGSLRAQIFLDSYDDCMHRIRAAIPEAHVRLSVEREYVGMRYVIVAAFVLFAFALYLQTRDKKRFFAKRLV